MLVQVLGPGCPKCEETYRTVLAAVAASGRPEGSVTVEKVTDFQAIASMGVFTTPAVAVDGAVKVAGRAPSKDEVLAWIA